MSKSPNLSKIGENRAFTLVEILVVAAIVAILLALMVAGVGELVSKSKSANCLANVRSMGTAYRLWWTDYGGRPPAYQEAGYNSQYFVGEIVANYLPGGKQLRCPLVPNKAAMDNSYGFRYGFNNELVRVRTNSDGSVLSDYRSLANLPVPLHRVVLVAEHYHTADFWSAGHLNRTMRSAGMSYPGSDSAGAVRQMHAGGLHLGFADGHAKLVVPTDGDWTQRPIRGDRTNGGFYYNRAEFSVMHNW